MSILLPKFMAFASDVAEYRTLQRHAKAENHLSVVGLYQEKGAENVKFNNDHRARQIATLVLGSLRRHYGEFDLAGHELATLMKNGSC